MKKPFTLLFVFSFLILSACIGKEPAAVATPEPAPLTPQIFNPVKWRWEAIQTGKGEYKLVFTATIDKGWHVYSQNKSDGDFSPTATEIIFENNASVEMVGKPTETGPKVHDGFDKVFEMNVKYFEDKMICEQKVKVLKDTRLKGNIYWGACDDSKCMPPDEAVFEFDLAVSGAVIPAPGKADTGKVRGSIGVPSPDDQKSFDSAVQAVIENNAVVDTSGQAPLTASADKYGEPVSDCGEKEEAMTLWLAIVLGFGGGLIALVTPCVFPMIPLTVSFFLKRSENKTKGRWEAIFYAFSIVLIYFLLSLPFAIFGASSDTLNEISTGAPLNVFFFLIFVFFAFSFFGYYEITLPAFIANKADSASNVGGLVGIFFMAITLAIVSFSCTGPILGTLIVSASTGAGGGMKLMAGMSSFGLALALPFGVFALFPTLMKSLPKSGGWLNSVKVVLGFVELIFALKFLSNADLVSHWGILKREVFLGIWVILGLGLFVYLIGLIRFKHDSASVKLAPIRIGTAIITLLFVGYSAYGIPGNDLKLFSGFPPPKFYSLFKTDIEIEPIKNNYAAALAKAKAENKLVMIDFTGWACVSCRAMEENVWTDIQVKQRLAERFVIVSLYVDDKEKLPENEQYISQGVPSFDGKKIKTIGNKFSEMQAKYFKSNTQPYYVLISPEEKLLNNPRGYTPDSKKYIDFLDCAWNASRQLSSN